MWLPVAVRSRAWMPPIGICTCAALFPSCLFIFLLESPALFCWIYFAGVYEWMNDKNVAGALLIRKGNQLRMSLGDIYNFHSFHFMGVETTVLCLSWGPGLRTLTFINALKKGNFSGDCGSKTKRKKIFEQWFVRATFRDRFWPFIPPVESRENLCIGFSPRVPL